jgi:hypothetical protein
MSKENAAWLLTRLEVIVREMEAVGAPCTNLKALIAEISEGLVG